VLAQALGSGAFATTKLACCKTNQKQLLAVKIIEK